ncbi:MAG TPA: hypothetical protein VG347_12630 [Verrucomicrobiae bacterium]|nr:hypothetical protein [Verrucomicrobiae bacterium]
MKTPREILLGRHRTASPKLDAVRHSVVNALNQQETVERTFPAIFVPSFLGCLKTLWRELILPSRHTWAGFATVWLLIFLVNFAQRDNVSSVTGKTVRPGGPVMTLQAQQRWVSEHFADRTLPTEADRPRIYSPKPRTATTITVTV